MKFKGRRQSSNVEDLRTSGRGRRSVGFKGGIIGTLAIALVIYLLGGNPLEVLNLASTGGQQMEAAEPLSAKDTEMGEFVSVVLADTEEVWHRLFADMGYTYREPKLVLFRSAVESACGFAQSATGPFYCPGDEKVYLDLEFLELLQQKLGAEGDFAVAYIIAHEVGHHVQRLLGTMDILDNARGRVSQPDMNELTVRLELQADFLAGVWIHHAQKMFNMMEEGDLDEALNAASAVGDDRIQMKQQGYVVPDSFTHGTSAQRKNWLKKGIQTGDYGQGDTFSRSVVL
ncbi:predicted metalloprotease [Bacteroidales bacterium 6E]|nr:predicted metalloprotease [Bacteroidales bacterium 6E]